MKTEFNIFEFIDTVARSKYYFVLHCYIHNKVSLRLLKDQMLFCQVHWAAADSPASKARNSSKFVTI